MSLHGNIRVIKNLHSRMYFSYCALFSYENSKLQQCMFHISQRHTLLKFSNGLHVKGLFVCMQFYTYLGFRVYVMPLGTRYINDIKH